MRALVGPEMRSRWLWTLGVVVLFRLGQTLPAPGAPRGGRRIDGLLDLLTGGGLHRLALLGLGVAPLLLVPGLLLLLRRDGDRPRSAWPPRLTAVGLGALLAVPVALTTPAARVPLLVLSLTVGTGLTVLLAELLTRRGIADGASVLLLVQLLAVVPGLLRAAGGPAAAVLVPVTLLVIGALAVGRTAERRVPVQWAKRMVGVRPPGGRSAYLPFGLGPAWPSAALLALLLLHLPAAVGLRLREDGPVYLTALPLLVLLFALIASAHAVDADGHADRLARQGAFVPGIRPGRPTAEYVSYVGRRVAWAGALLGAVVATLPALAAALTGASDQVSGTALLLLALAVVDVTGHVLHRSGLAHAVRAYAARTQDAPSG
ncbi:hypothetical protein ACIRBX_35290 [Kitasatospora sp. NPDC096147]|uniref:hypothetical protein n=1 Tax=Kitasatospora sp. NPDC096147 TaxID=3364093 RepID=UPI0037FB2CD6